MHWSRHLIVSQRFRIHLKKYWNNNDQHVPVVKKMIVMGAIEDQTHGTCFSSHISALIIDLPYLAPKI